MNIQCLKWLKMTNLKQKINKWDVSFEENRNFFR